MTNGDGHTVARKKKNRCRLKSCNVVIKDEFLFCYMHRKLTLKSLGVQTVTVQPIPRLNRYFCDSCGQSIRALCLKDCTYCGGKTEEVGD